MPSLFSRKIVRRWRGCIVVVAVLVLIAGVTEGFRPRYFYGGGAVVAAILAVLGGMTIVFLVSEGGGVTALFMAKK